MAKCIGRGEWESRHDTSGCPAELIVSWDSVRIVKDTARSALRLEICIRTHLSTHIHTRPALELDTPATSGC